MILTVLFIIIELSAYQLPDIQQAPPIPEANQLSVLCAEQVLTAEAPETLEMPKREDFVNEDYYKIAKAKYINGGTWATLEDGTVCEL